jgi:hypothetical protein
MHYIVSAFWAYGGNSSRHIGIYMRNIKHKKIRHRYVEVNTERQFFANKPERTMILGRQAGGGYVLKNYLSAAHVTRAAARTHSDDKVIVVS